MLVLLVLEQNGHHRPSHVRGSVPVGYDNDRVYGDLLGVTADQLESLRRDKII